MSKNILDTIKGRSRPRVPDREDELIPREGSDISDDESAEPEAIAESQSPLQTAKQMETHSELNSEGLNNYPSELRRITLRIDAETYLGINSNCSREKITAETLTEAVYALLLENSTLMEKAIANAKERYNKRQFAAVRKRTATLQEKYGE